MIDARAAKLSDYSYYDSYYIQLQRVQIGQL